MNRLTMIIVSSVALILLGGCDNIVRGSIDGGLMSRTTNEYGSAYLLPARPLIPNATLQLTPSFGISAENLLIGAAIVAFVDPLAPNWSADIERLSESTFRVAMRMKRFKTGGDGEAVPILKRHAEQITRDLGAPGYAFVSLTEGIESETIGAIRVASAVIEVRRKVEK